MSFASRTLMSASGKPDFASFWRAKPCFRQAAASAPSGARNRPLLASGVEQHFEQTIRWVAQLSLRKFRGTRPGTRHNYALFWIGLVVVFWPDFCILRIVLE